MESYSGGERGGEGKGVGGGGRGEGEREGRGGRGGTDRQTDRFEVLGTICKEICSTAGTAVSRIMFQ